VTCFVPSVLWRCWLDGRKGIQPVKNWVVGCWRGYLSGARCRLAYGPADATATHCLLFSVKSRLVFPFWYRLTWVVPEKAVKHVCVCIATYLMSGGICKYEFVANLPLNLSSVLWHCCLGIRKSISPVKIEWWGIGVIVCLERGAHCLHMIQLIPLLSQNLIISCLI